MDRAAIKEKAKQLLKKNHWICVAVAFLGTLTLGGGTGTSFNFNYDQTTDGSYTTSPFEQMPEYNPEVFFGIMAVFIFSLVITSIIKVFLTNQLMVGSSRFFLKYRKNNPTDVGELFQSYKDKTFLNVAKVTFLRDLFISIWSLLFIVPGIIKSFEYWAVDYILAVKPDTEYEKALELSKKITYGHKAEIFVMDLSFLGWDLLSILTCGILSICYVNPYKRIAMAELYAEIREDALRRGIVSPYDVPDYIEYQPQSPYYPYYQNPQQPYYGTQPMNGGYYQQPAYQPIAPAQPDTYQQGMYQQTVGSTQQEPQPQPHAYGQAQFQMPVQQPIAQQVSPVVESTPAQMSDGEAPSTEVSILPETPVAPEAPETPDMPVTEATEAE